MSATLADLIRAHQANARTLYAAPESDRISTPGRYDQTGSQRSPALDRRIEKLVARSLGGDLGVPEEDFPGIDDLEDLNDLLHPEEPGVDEPDFPDPEPPEEPEPPEPPEEPDPPVEPLPPIPGTGSRIYALHSGAISVSEDGGSTWARYSGSPGAPIGFSVSGGGIYVATASSISYSHDLLTWTDLSLPMAGEVVQIEGFQNGSFEGGLSGWETISGDSPRAGYIERIIPTDGVSYLRRDWVTFSAGEFTIEQVVNLSPSEVSALAHGATLRLSADAWADGGAQVQISVSGQTSLPVVSSLSMSGPSAGVAGDFFESSGFAMAPGGRSLKMTAQVVSVGGATTVGPSGVGNIALGGSGSRSASLDYFVTYQDTGEPYTGAIVFQMTDLDADETASISGSGVSHVLPSGSSVSVSGGTFSGTALVDPGDAAGSVVVLIENASFFTVSYSGAGFGWTAAPSGLIPEQPLVPLIVASRSSPIWENIVAEGEVGPYESLRVIVVGEGNPAEVFVDNMKLELIVPTDIELNVAVIGGGRVAVNGGIYSLAPAGLSFEMATPFDPTGITGGGAIWGGGSIFVPDEGATYTLPQTVVKAFDDPAGILLLMSGGEVWRRDDDPDYPGWDTIGDTGGAVDLVMAGGGGVAIGGSLLASSTLETWNIVSAETYGNDRIFASDSRVMAFNTGSSMLYWVDHSGWHLAGSLTGGIIDISA